MKTFRTLLAVSLALLYTSAFAACGEKHAPKDVRSPPPVTDTKQL